MRGDLLRDFQPAAIFQVRGNARRPERVTPDFGLDAGILGPPSKSCGTRRTGSSAAA